MGYNGESKASLVIPNQDFVDYSPLPPKSSLEGVERTTPTRVHCLRAVLSPGKEGKYGNQMWGRLLGHSVQNPGKSVGERMTSPPLLFHIEAGRHG